MPPQQTADAGILHRLQRAQAIVVGARRDDLRIKFARGVEVVIVRGQPGSREPFGLLVGQHAEGDARLHAELAHRADHVEHLLELRPILDLAPGRPHAKARRSQLFRPDRFGPHGFERHQRRGFNAGLEASALGDSSRNPRDNRRS